MNNSVDVNSDLFIYQDYKLCNDYLFNVEILGGALCNFFMFVVQTRVSGSNKIVYNFQKLVSDWKLLE